MNEDAYQIFEYIPIRLDKIEDEYIKHLWDAFVVLNSNQGSGKSFSIMPFHILFMMVLQYKVLRIKQQREIQYIERIRKWHKAEKQKLLLKANSVFEFGLLAETSLPGILNIIGLSEDSINKIKNLVMHRNDNVAHAKGGHLFDVDEKIYEYLSCLSEVQKCMELLNNEVTKNWLKEIENEESLDDFKERKLASTYLCNEDFRSGDMQLLVNSSDTPFSEWLTYTSEEEFIL